MGVHVILDIDPRGIDPAAWARVYHETSDLLAAWKPRLLGWGVRTIAGERVPMYTRSIHCDDGSPTKACWRVVGDRESLQTAECQSMYRDLAHYSTREARSRGARAGSRADLDIVIEAARPKNETTGGPVRVFGDKTQGHPYHFAVLAAAMLVEERFPRHAMVWGDIDRGQAEEARRMAAPLIGRDLPLPVRVDAPRLVERLRERYDRDALAGAIERVYISESDGQESVLRLFPGEEGAEPWRRALAKHTSSRSLGVTWLLVDWLNAGRDLRDACRFACLAPEGPRFSAEDFVDALASTWVAIPRPARGILAAFERPSGAAPSVASQLGGFLLDMEATGRHLRADIDPEELAASLLDVFGAEGKALYAALCAKSAKIEEQLAEHEGGVRDFVAHANESAEDDTERLATLSSPESMGPAQRRWVQAMAWTTVQVLATLRGDSRMAKVLVDVDEARRLITRVLAAQGPVLTEDAWDTLLAERDVETAAWRVALVSLRADEIHQSQVRRALLENVALLRHAMALGRDEAQMREVGELVAKARKERPEKA